MRARDGIPSRAVRRTVAALLAAALGAACGVKGPPRPPVEPRPGAEAPAAGEGADR